MTGNARRRRARRRGVVLAGILVGVLAVGSVSSLTAQAEKGSSSGGSTSGGAGGSGGSSGSSGGSGKSGGADDVIRDIPTTGVKGEDNPSSSIPTVSSVPGSSPGSSPSSTPGNGGLSAPSTAKANTVSTIAPISSGGSRRFERTTTCGALIMAVEVRSEKSTLRVKTTIDKTSATWNAVVLQERRVTWRGSARKGRIDRVLTDLPGPELLTVRLTSTTGAVCVAELQLPG